MCLRDNSELVGNLSNVYETNSCIEKTLGDLQLKKVGVAVASATAATGSISQRRTDQIGASPVIKLTVTNSNDLSRLRAAKSAVNRTFIRKPPRYSWL